MSCDLDSTDHLIESANVTDELHVCLGDTADLIEAKLAEYQVRMDGRMARLAEEIVELRARIAEARAEAEARSDSIENLVDHIR